MKTRQRIFACFLALVLCMSLAAHTPLPVAAKGADAGVSQPVRQSMHITLDPETREVVKYTTQPVKANPVSSQPKTGQAVGLAATVTMMTEGFEGNFPADNGWTLIDQNGPTGGEYLWGATDYQKKTGSKSGWEAVGGADGFNPTASNYQVPANLTTMMIYGPFDLSDATAATMTFSYWAQTSFSSPTGIGVMASGDNNEYNGFQASSYFGGWSSDSLDFSNVDGQGLSLLGDSTVYLMFGFQSGAVDTGEQGVYIDDIVLTKTTSTPTGCYSLTTGVEPAGSGSVSVNIAPNCTTDPAKYAAGTQVVLTATPASGYVFGEWEGSATGSVNPLTVTMNANKSITADFTPQTCFTLTVAADPAGGGTVSRDVQPDCDGNTKYYAGTVVTLTATPNSGYNFTDWTVGANTETTNPVEVTVSADTTVTANFDPEVCYTLTITKDPTAGGTVTADPTPNCNGNTQYDEGTVVTLTAAPSTLYEFDKWSGDASGTSTTTTVTMSANRSVTAEFNQLICYSLTVTPDPSAGGSVAVDTAPNCGTQYIDGTSVKLTATANTGYTFDEWAGSLSSTTNPVTITMNANKTITARFERLCYSLTKTASPSAGGSVAADPAPNCATDSSKYSHGTSVTLTATPSSGYTFGSWTGASGSGNTATVTMDANKTVTANFTEICYSLTVNKSPSAGGSVAADPAPNCNADSSKYKQGAVVTLTATPGTGYTFGSWTGASGSGNTATVTMDVNKTVTANFTQLCYSLTKTADPSAGGTISASPDPNCSTDNSKYAHGTEVTLTAAASTGYDFVKWSGAASGTSTTAKVTMTADRSVTAEFEILCYSLSTSVAPSSGGSVSPNTAPNCGTKYTHGTAVTLTATGAGNYNFANWTGDATGSENPLTVTMDEDKTITANFTKICYTLTTTVDPASTGTVTPNPAPNCDGTQYAAGSQVQLTAVASSGYAFKDWTGAVTGTTNPITVTMNANRTVTANFVVANPAPTLTSLNKPQVLAEGKDTQLVLTGTGFIASSSVTWNGAALTGVQYISSTELRVTIPGALLSAPGKVNLVVVNPAPGGGSSSPVQLEIIPLAVEDIKVFLPITVK